MVECRIRDQETPGDPNTQGQDGSQTNYSIRMTVISFFFVFFGPKGPTSTIKALYQARKALVQSEGSNAGLRTPSRVREDPLSV